MTLRSSISKINKELAFLFLTIFIFVFKIVELMGSKEVFKDSDKGSVRFLDYTFKVKLSSIKSPHFFSDKTFFILLILTKVCINKTKIQGKSYTHKLFLDNTQRKPVRGKGKIQDSYVFT